MRENLEDLMALVAGDGGPHRIHQYKAAADQARSSVQEWTGQDWQIVEVMGEPGRPDPSPLDAANFPGQYVGQRVVTA